MKHLQNRQVYVMKSITRFRNKQHNESNCVYKLADLQVTGEAIGKTSRRLWEQQA